MIYDCFTFFNELDMLEVRLNELSEVVDRFVLVEATKTHQGKDKPLYYAENKVRFEKFKDRIIHIVVDEYPEYEGHSAWLLEHHQRNMIMKGLEDCKPGDVILISDADEIPNPKKIIEFKDKKGIKIFKQRMFYYYLNCVNDGNTANDYSWIGTAMVSFSPALSPQRLRTLSMTLMGSYRGTLWQKIQQQVKNIFSKEEAIHFIDHGGWHFSYLGGVEKIIHKLEAFAHTEFNKQEYKDPQKIKSAINSGKDVFGRDFTYQFIEVDNTYPEYIVKNQGRFSHLIKTD